MKFVKFNSNNKFHPKKRKGAHIQPYTQNLRNKHRFLHRRKHFQFQMFRTERVNALIKISIRKYSASHIGPAAKRVKKEAELAD